MIGSFTYKNPSTVKDAVAALATEWGQTEVLAGGSDLLAAMKDQIAAPQSVVNIKRRRRISVRFKSAMSRHWGGISASEIVTGTTAISFLPRRRTISLTARFFPRRGSHTFILPRWRRS